MKQATVNIESVKVANYRTSFGALAPLGTSIRDEGLRHPIALWSDGTIISGTRRLRAHFLLAGAPGGERYRKIRAIFVDTIEDAAKRIITDNEDDYLREAMKPSELCRLWQTGRMLDAPAARRRREEARRRGVQLRKQTLEGERTGGRFSYSEDHFLNVMSQPFNMSEATASRLWRIFDLANTEATGDKAMDARDRARNALRLLDEGKASISGAYTAIIRGHRVPTVRSEPQGKAAPADKQLAAWERSLPALEGLAFGLAELGPPHPDLTWEQVGPVRARLAAVRRELDKITKKMKENDE